MPSPSHKQYRVRRGSSSSSSSSESIKKTNVKQRSRSRSPSDSNHGKKERGRSRSRSRRHSRSVSHRDSRSTSCHRSRSRSRLRSDSSSRYRSRISKDEAPVRPVTSDKPEFLNSRVFVGHLPSDRITNEEFQHHFSRYGKILDSVVHYKGYGFVQFSNEQDALRAVAMEKSALLKGNVIDVKMAAEGRRDRRDVPPQVRDRRTSPPFEQGPSAGYHPPSALAARDRSPIRDPYHERFRDPYRDGRYPARDPLGPRLPRDALIPPRRDDPFFDEPYRRPVLADPYYDRFRDDPYRRDPFVDPYVRDPYSSTYREPVSRVPLKMECMIVLMNTSLRDYGISIELRLKKFGIITDICVIPEDRTLQQQIEDVSRRGGIFAVIVNSQNEVHQSITVNILHGTPQEHRNMPFEDALTLISTSFKKYLQSMREKDVAAVPLVDKEMAPASLTKAFIPPPKDVSYLLNLLADNRQLTVEELDKVIFYLRERRDKILEREGHPKLATEALSAYGESRPDNSALQHQELQSKILGMLNQNGTGGVSSSSVQTPQPVTGLAPAAIQQPPATQSSSALINFDNPSVQKALDNLIQNGPNLLRNITGVSQSQQPISTSSPSVMASPHSVGGLAPSYNQMYGTPSSRPSLLQNPEGMPRY